MANDLTVQHERLKRLAAKSQGVMLDARANGKTMPPTVSSKGGKFFLVENGDRRPAPNQLTLAFVVVAAKKPRSRAFYEGKFDASPDANYSPPVCWSLDSVTPEDDVVTKQNDTCRTCKRAEFGSAMTEQGNASTQCKEHKQLVVKVIGADGLWLLNIPVASIKKQWDVYAAEIESMGREEKAKDGYEVTTVSTIVTAATIDTNIWSFKRVAYVSDEQVEKFLDLDELEKMIDDKETAAKYLWGEKGLEREAQFKNVVPALPRPIRQPLPDAPLTEGVAPEYMTSSKPVETATRTASPGREPEKQATQAPPFEPDSSKEGQPTFKDMGYKDLPDSHYVPPGAPEAPKPATRARKPAATTPIFTKIENTVDANSVLAKLGLGDLDI